MRKHLKFSPRHSLTPSLSHSVRHSVPSPMNLNLVRVRTITKSCKPYQTQTKALPNPYQTLTKPVPNQYQTLPKKEAGVQEAQKEQKESWQVGLRRTTLLRQRGSPGMNGGKLKSSLKRARPSRMQPW